MSRLLVAQRALTVPGWAKDALWRRARAVPSLDLRFADNKSLTDATTGSNLVTFTRASSGTFVGSAGVIQTAATDAPRFDHNPTTGESLGLLVEEQRTNLLLRSEEFGDASWTKGNASITANSIAAPNGTLTGAKIVEDTSSATHYARRSTSPTINTNPITFSVYVKAAERIYVGLAIQEATTFTRQSNVNFNLGSGTANTVGNIGGAGSASATIIPVGNGWYRCTLTTTLGGTDTNALSWIYVSTSSGFNYTGDGTSGIYLWGAQLEAGAFPTSYIPTTTAAVTRSADVASITGSAFSGWYRQDEGTVFAEGSTFNTSAASCLVSIDDTTVSNRIQLRRSPDASKLRMVSSGGAIDATLTTGTALGLNKIAAGVAVSNQNLVSNGVLATGITSITPMPTVTQARIGSGTASSVFNGTIRRLTYWPQRLANSTLQQITQ